MYSFKHFADRLLELSTTFMIPQRRLLSIYLYLLLFRINKTFAILYYIIKIVNLSILILMLLHIFFIKVCICVFQISVQWSDFVFQWLLLTSINYNYYDSCSVEMLCFNMSILSLTSQNIKDTYFEIRRQMKLDMWIHGVAAHRYIDVNNGLQII